MRKILLVGLAAFLFLFGLALVLSLFVASTAGDGATLSFGKKLAVLPVKGEISSEKSVRDGVYADDLVEDLDKAEKDSTVAGIFLDIDSPGGSVVPTKQIVYKIRSLEKPVVAYIGEMGASGGYYIAASADYVVADEDSLTGSIGVISLLPNLQGLLEKIGVKMEVLKEGENKAIASPFTELTADQRKIMQGLLSDVYAKFKADVLAFRKGKVRLKLFDELADGRILSGRQALDAGLIDLTGSKEDALKKAAELSGIEGEPELVKYEKKELSLLDFFMQAGSAFGYSFKNALVSDARLSIK
ncbi:MAG: signal peptide peptidase SppA [Candidatus Diapherotrites archaeon]|uniref:Signal peptide peptidase SppA n=1 Tax=Candidatus Iainarchaeum sp. TaxID=3101447 RepID=A0A8T4L837_9ARCH|nr:signal peptide peptidase SppA [Candidatus Diapherotrites archaeon]